MKKLLKISIIFLFVFSFPLNVFSFDFNINSKEVILINLVNNHVLYEQNSREKTNIASLTKIATAIVVLEKVSDLDEKVTLINDDFNGLKEKDASLSGLKINTLYSYRDLLYGLLLESGADCANALARLVGVNIESFVSLMNKKAQTLQMFDTNFDNPIGFDSPNNYSTAYDLSILFRYAIENPLFLEIIETMEYKTYDNIEFTNTIKAYKDKYNLTMNYILGGKTGLDTKAGYCLATIATYNNVNYMLITTNAPYSKTEANHFLDALNIYGYYITNYNFVIVFPKNSALYDIDTKYAKKDKVTIFASKDYLYYLEKSFDKSKITTKFKGSSYVDYRTKVGEKLGTLSVYYNNELIDTIDLILEEKVPFNLISYFKSNKLVFYFALEIIVGTSILIIVSVFSKKRKQNSLKGN